MTANKVVINDLLSYLVRDEDMPELVAWLNEHQDTTACLDVRSKEERTRLLLEMQSDELYNSMKEEIDWLNTDTFQQHNEEMESQDDE